MTVTEKISVLNSLDETEFIALARAAALEVQADGSEAGAIASALIFRLIRIIAFKNQFLETDPKIN